VLANNPSWRNQQVRDYLVNNSTPNVVSNPGTGTPNRLLFLVDALPASNFGVSVAPTSGGVVIGGSTTATVSTSNTGATQSVSLAASGLPAGATASFSPATVTSGGSSTLTIATSASTPAGTYALTVSGTGTSGTRSATYLLTVVDGPGGCSASNGVDVPIQDVGPAALSTLTIVGCDRNPSASSKVAVTIAHTYRGDLLIDLVAPDGTAFRLKNSNPYDNADNVNSTYTVNVSAESANGSWTLRARDLFDGDAGYVNAWTLTL
jgi:hypothetical protein